MITTKELERHANQGITIVVNGVEMTFSMLYDSIGAHPMWCADNGLRAYCGVEVGGEIGLFIDIDDEEGEHIASLGTKDTFETFVKYCTTCAEYLRNMRMLSCPVCHKYIGRLYEEHRNVTFNVLELDMSNEFSSVDTVLADRYVTGYRCPDCNHVEDSAYDFCIKAIGDMK